METKLGDWRFEVTSDRLETRSLISRSWAIRFEQQYYYSKWKEWRKIRGWKVLVEMEMERGEREEIVMPSLSLSSSRGDPLRLIYSKGMMRHCVMLNAAFMTRSWSSHADFWLRIINQLGRVSLPHLLSSPSPPPPRNRSSSIQLRHLSRLAYTIDFA